jgi:hypothetical protein
MLFVNQQLQKLGLDKNLGLCEIDKLNIDRTNVHLKTICYAKIN